MIQCAAGCPQPAAGLRRRPRGARRRAHLPVRAGDLARAQRGRLPPPRRRLRLLLSGVVVANTAARPTSACPPAVTVAATSTTPARGARSTAPRLPRHRLEHCSSVTRGLPRNGPNCARDVARLGRRHGFGFVGEKAGRSMQLMSGDRAAAYLWSYSVRGTGSKATLQENARNPHLPRMLIWVSPRLTRPSGVTMRNLRRCRQLWAVRRGLLPPPSWSAVEFARIVNLAGPWPARGRKSPRCRGDRLRVVRRRAGKSGRRRSSA